jgi:hypothetical protein
MAHHNRCPQCSAHVPEGSRFCQKCGTPCTPDAGGSKPHKPQKNHKPSKAGVHPVLILVAAVLIVTGSIIAVQQMFMHSSPDMAASMGEMAMQKGEIDGAGPMPAWLKTADKAIVADYAWAAAHNDELQYFPCFCGCWDNAGHRSNSDCYYEHDGNGKVTGYDQHAYG